MATKWNGTFGVEIELLVPTTAGNGRLVLGALLRRMEEAGVLAIRTGRYPRWSVKTDCSVGGHPGYAGWEVVSPVLSGEEGITEVRAVMAALREMGCKVNRTCGLHVHFGVRDGATTTVPFPTLRRFVQLYLKYEDEIALLLPESRRTAGYARPNKGVFRGRAGQGVYREGRDVTTAEWLKAVGSCRDERELRAMFPDRYVRVNLMALQRHGTVEIRAHQGTLNGEKVANWIRLLGQMMAVAAKSKRINAPVNEAGTVEARLLRWLSKMDRDVRSHYVRRFEQINAMPLRVAARR